MKEHIRYFDDIAPEWDSLFSDEERLEEAVNKMNISPAEKILDVGCGTGRLIPHIQRKLKKTGMVLGLDFSLQMLINAKRKIFKGLNEFVNGYAEELPFRDDKFDRIICFAVFPHIISKEKAVWEFNRILRRNGILNIFHLKSREELNEFHKNLNNVINKDLLPDEDTMRRILKNGGFREINIINEPSFNYMTCKKT
ncbi:class I SAM-dependent methyltransferase [candidate division KSB1 bacterium]